MKKKFIHVLLTIFLGIIASRLLYLGVFRHDYYLKEYAMINEQTIRGASAPRGRILDVNGKVLVDNVGVNTIIYNRLNNKEGVSEVELAFELGNILKYDAGSFSEYKLKKFYIAEKDGAKDLITDEEWDLYNKRKLTSDDIESLKYERIDESILSKLDYEYRNASYIYSILNTGYYYENKILKRGVTDEEVAKLNEENLAGVDVLLTWERIYPYGETLKSVFGNISTNGVPKEYKDYYSKKGVGINSTVGTSALEFQYDEYLRGKDALYEVSGGNLSLKEEEKQGADLYLSIDIDVQLEVEETLKAEIKGAKNFYNTQSFNHAYVLVGNPKDGSILALSGLMLSKDKFFDITINVINSSYTVGSVVKGASMSVGYQQGLIEVGKQVWDSCIKVYNTPQKCSWTRLGYMDDIRAMAQSSNYYQFLIATRLTNPNYTWNARLNATKESFDVYRNMFASYGLGVITEVDLPNEHTGIIGRTVSDDLLLNLTIGQYDTYTPMEMFQYVNTIANDGIRLAPTLMNKIVRDGEVLLNHEARELGRVDLGEEYIARVQQGFRAVMTSGTGYYYADQKYKGAGKTGTSETFVDTDGDGNIDTGTLSTSFIMYAPVDDPKYSIVIMSPNIAQVDNGTYIYSINSRINRKITNYLFENS